MKICTLLQQAQPVFSFEFFPPKNDAGFEELYKTIGKLKELRPTFISVTYGAGGSTRRKTVELVAQIKHEIGIESMAHLTCVGATRADIDTVLAEIHARGIENILALRGDPPRGEKTFVATEGGFKYANELVEFIKQRYSFCLGVAGYPEGHLESPSLEQDLVNLKRKVEAGGEFIITQLFFDNRFYFDFVERARRIGITVPIIPGIMPILNVNQIKRFTDMCGASIPPELLRRLEALQDDQEAIEACGIEHATIQCRELLANGAPGIHFYTLNRSKATWQIFQNLQKR